MFYILKPLQYGCLWTPQDPNRSKVPVLGTAVLFHYGNRSGAAFFKSVVDATGGSRERVQVTIGLAATVLAESTVLADQTHLTTQFYLMLAESRLLQTKNLEISIIFLEISMQKRAVSSHL